MVFESTYNQLGISLGVIILITIWETIWTGIAMWKSAKRGHLVWFVVFLLVNLLAIPEIIYLLVTRKKDKGRKRSRVRQRRKRK